MKKHKCATPYCRNKVTTTKHCSTCRSRKSRERDKVKYTYHNLKHNSKRRNKPFDLSLDEFKSFCTETNYMQGKGKTKTSYSIDCIINELGYTKDNIHVLTIEENSRKGTKILVYDWQTRQAVVINTRTIREVPEDDQPF